MARLVPIMDVGEMLGGVSTRPAIRRRLDALGVPVVRLGRSVVVDPERVEAAIRAVGTYPDARLLPPVTGKMPVPGRRLF